MTRKAMLIVSFVSVVVLGWVVFRSPALTPALVDAAFITSLIIFLACIVSECNDAIARSTRPRGRGDRPMPPAQPIRHAPKRGAAPPAAAATKRASTPDREASQFRPDRRMTG